MEYYNDVKGRCERIVLDEYDLKVKENVDRIYKENSKALNDEVKLYNAVEHYYREEIGIMNNRLQKVIDYYANAIFGVEL